MIFLRGRPADPFGPVHRRHNADRADQETRL